MNLYFFMTAAAILLFANPAEAQKEHVYWIYFKTEKPIGKLITSETDSAKFRKYKLRSNLSFTFVKEFTVNFQLETLYKNGILIDGSTVNVVSGKTKNTSTVTKKADVYLLNLNGERKKLNDKVITYSTSKLYFYEPKNSKKVYSEKHGAYFPLEKVGEKSYKMTMAHGRHNIYSYNSEGLCDQIHIENGFKSFTMRLKKN